MSKGKLSRIHLVVRIALFVLCAAAVTGALIYHYKPDLFALAGQDVEAPAPKKEPPLDGIIKPDLKPPPKPKPKPELDAPDPGEAPVIPSEAPPKKKAPAKKTKLTKVDGNNLFALVTKQTTLGRYAPGDLKRIPSKYVLPGRRGNKYYLRSEPLVHLADMWEEADKGGVQLTVTSAYRSYDTQVSTFNYWVQKYGEAKAVTFSARAGQSEHQLGTTLDFNIDTYAGKEQHQWLAKHAYKFGFALSYPQGAQDITGYKYEPWHYRYIGVEAAKEWKASGQPLCVFLETKQ